MLMITAPKPHRPFKNPRWAEEGPWQQLWADKRHAPSLLNTHSLWRLATQRPCHDSLTFAKPRIMISSRKIVAPRNELERAPNNYQQHLYRKASTLSHYSQVTQGWEAGEGLASLPGILKGNSSSLVTHPSDEFCVLLCPPMALKQGRKRNETPARRN